MKYREWLFQWLTICVKPTVKTRTYEKYADVIKRQILPSLGDFELENLSAPVLQNFVAALSKKYSSNTVLGIMAVARGSLRAAVNMGIVERQYFGMIKPPKAKEKKIECFTAEEQRKIEKYIFESRKEKLLGVVFCFYTGLRIGELLALRWTDFDFAKGTVKVSKSCRDVWRQGSYFKEIGTPKTEMSNREIPLPKQLLPYLREMREKGTSEELFERVSVRAYQKAFESLLKKLNIPHRGFHSIRHTFATRALECGMDIRTLSEILGHQNPAITLKRYAHSMFEYKQAMMNEIGKLLP